MMKRHFIWAVAVGHRGRFWAGAASRRNFGLSSDRIATFWVGLDWPALAAFLLPLALYWRTLAPTIYNLDSAELTTAAATGGIVRATGYPMYLILGRIWAWLPVGDVGYRLNLMSAFLGALTVLWAELILRRLGVRAWARLGALGLLATAPYFWSLSLIAEVYTLHTALLGALLLSLMRWAERPSPGRLAWPTLLFALSLGNHGATVLLAPACFWYVITSHPGQLRRPANWLAGALAAGLGLSVFLYLPWRYAADPAFNYAGWFDAGGAFQAVDLSRPAGLWWLITGQSFSSRMFDYSLVELPGQLAGFGRELWQAFMIIGLGPGLVGGIVLWRRHWRLAGLLSLVFLLHTWFYVNYRVVDKATMYLPSYLVWAIWLGLGYQTLLDWLKPLQLPWSPPAGAESRPARRQTARQTPLWATRALILAAVLLALGWNWARVDRSGDWSTREQSEEILGLVGRDALVFGWWETVPGLQYLQLVEGKRPDVLAVNRFLISGPDMVALIRREAGRRPVYINNPPLPLIQEMSVTRVGPLFRLSPRPEAVQAAADPGR